MADIDQKLDIPKSTRDSLVTHGYEPQMIIGQGTFGKVYLATRKADGFQVAIKILSNSFASTSLYRVYKEISILK